jgi:creatinine amidohydrolase
MLARYDDLTFPDFRDRVGPRTLVVWPIGILEAHGPHLPLATDAIQAEWGCERLAERTGALLLAPLRFGNGTATAPYPGTISLAFDTVRAVARDVLSELARHGVKRVMVVSGHLGQGHMRALKLAAEETLAARPDLKLAVLSDWEVVYELRTRKGVPGIPDDAVPADDGHAGTLETARMLAIAPQLCRMERAPKRVPKAPIPEFRVTLGLDREYPLAVLGGDASRATAELGHAVNRYVLDRLTLVAEELLKEA